MGSIIGWLVGKTIFGRPIDEKGAGLIAKLGLVLLVFSILGGVVAWVRRDAVSDHEAKIVARAAPATNRAAAERAQDTIAESKHAEELHNAIHSVPDAPPAGPSHALACKRLHDLGRDTAACR